MILISLSNKITIINFRSLKLNEQIKRICIKKPFCLFGEKHLRCFISQSEAFFFGIKRCKIAFC